MTALVASPARAQEPPAPTPTLTTTAPAVDTTTTLPAPVATTAAPGTYSSPRWLPLRRDLTGTEVTVGCTFNSYGSQHGYECGGHHNRWAIDFLADSGTPVYAAGAGFATNLTGKPGGSGFGNVISIDHGFGITTLYAHLTTALVPPEGTWVDETTLLGTVGQTGSASAPHLHFEEFAGPGGSNSANPVSIDPGPLFACRGDVLVSFPQVAGFASWEGLPWGSLTVASDGNQCLGGGAPLEAKPATPVPATPRSTTTSTTGDDSTGDESTSTAGTVPSNPWSELIAPILNLIGSTSSRLHLPG
jgi:hypothetical protein